MTSELCACCGVPPLQACRGFDWEVEEWLASDLWDYVVEHGFCLNCGEECEGIPKGKNGLCEACLRELQEEAFDDA